MWTNSQFSADLVTFTEEILNRKLHFLCSDFTKNKFRSESDLSIVNNESLSKKTKEIHEEAPLLCYQVPNKNGYFGNWIFEIMACETTYEFMSA